MSLSCGLSLCQSFELRQELKVNSEWLESCLPLSQEVVRENKSEILRVYKWDDRITKQPVRHYRSILDMILCNLYPYYKRGCKYHYKGKGKRLDMLYPVPHIKFLDRELSTHLKKLLKDFHK